MSVKPLRASQTLKSLMFCIIQCKLKICISILKCNNGENGLKEKKVKLCLYEASRGVFSPCIIFAAHLYLFALSVIIAKLLPFVILKPVFFINLICAEAYYKHCC